MPQRSWRRVLLQQIDPHVALYRDPVTGIAWVEDGHTGTGASAHPNISSTGSIRGMKNLGYWDRGDKVVRSNGFYYNVSHSVVGPSSDDYTKLAAQYCQCEGCTQADRDQGTTR